MITSSNLVCYLQKYIGPSNSKFQGQEVEYLRKKWKQPCSYWFFFNHYFSFFGNIFGMAMSFQDLLLQVSTSTIDNLHKSSQDHLHFYQKSVFRRTLYISLSYKMTSCPHYHFSRQIILIISQVIVSGESSRFIYCHYFI